MEPRVTLITLGVADLERAVDFYRDVVGWDPASVVEDDVAFFDLDGFILALWRDRSLASDIGAASVEREEPSRPSRSHTTRDPTTRSTRSSHRSASAARGS